MAEIYNEQPISSHGVWNRVEQRPLEGFVYAITPFNFTSIAGNLPAAPALMGNVVVWKPAETQIYSANVLMEIFREAGLPDGVINMIFVDGPAGGKVMSRHPDFVGVHFTGSTEVFKKIWKAIGEHVAIHNTRFIVSNMKEDDARSIYFGFYVQRGEASENRIKEVKNMCFSDRLSAKKEY